MIEAFCKGLSVGSLIMTCIALSFGLYTIAQASALLSIAAACVAFIHHRD
jgi:hypothetical protein